MPFVLLLKAPPCTSQVNVVSVLSDAVYRSTRLIRMSREKHRVSARYFTFTEGSRRAEFRSPLTIRRLYDDGPNDYSD